jgi:hypothetical protein
VCVCACVARMRTPCLTRGPACHRRQSRVRPVDVSTLKTPSSLMRTPREHCPTVRGSATCIQVYPFIVDCDDMVFKCVRLCALPCHASECIRSLLTVTTWLSTVCLTMCCTLRCVGLYVNLPRVPPCLRSLLTVTCVVVNRVSDHAPYHLLPTSFIVSF